MCHDVWRTNERLAEGPSSLGEFDRLLDTQPRESIGRDNAGPPLVIEVVHDVLEAAWRV